VRAEPKPQQKVQRQQRRMEAGGGIDVAEADTKSGISATTGAKAPTFAPASRVPTSYSAPG